MGDWAPPVDTLDEDVLGLAQLFDALALALEPLPPLPGADVAPLWPPHEDC